VPMQPDARAALEEQLEKEGRLWTQDPQRLREVPGRGHGAREGSARDATRATPQLRNALAPGRRRHLQAVEDPGTMLRPAFGSCVVAVAILRQRRTLQTRSQRSFGHRTRRGFTSSCGTPSRRFPRTPALPPSGLFRRCTRFRFVHAKGGASSAPTRTAWTTPGSRPVASNHVSDRRCRERRCVPQSPGCAIRVEKPATPLEHELPSRGFGSQGCEDDSSATCTAFGCNVTTAKCSADSAPSETASIRLRPGRRALRPSGPVLHSFSPSPVHGGYRPARSMPRRRRSVTRRASACR
jgi:hypothetical protein